MEARTIMSLIGDAGMSFAMTEYMSLIPFCSSPLSLPRVLAQAFEYKDGGGSVFLSETTPSPSLLHI